MSLFSSALPLDLLTAGLQSSFNVTRYTELMASLETMEKQPDDQVVPCGFIAHSLCYCNSR